MGLLCPIKTLYLHLRRIQWFLYSITSLWNEIKRLMLNSNWWLMTVYFVITSKMKPWTSMRWTTFLPQNIILWQSVFSSRWQTKLLHLWLVKPSCYRRYINLLLFATVIDNLSMRFQVDTPFGMKSRNKYVATTWIWRTYRLILFHTFLIVLNSSRRIFSASNSGYDF